MVPVKWKYVRPLQGKENGRKKETEVMGGKRRKEMQSRARKKKKNEANKEIKEEQIIEEDRRGRKER